MTLPVDLKFPTLECPNLDNMDQVVIKRVATFNNLAFKWSKFCQPTAMF